ncbi:MAG: L,D-transpeptidase family protein [Vicinamibacterales bacterium]
MRIVIILVAAIIASSCGTDDRLASARIRAQVEAARTPEYATRNKEARRLWTSTRDFYRARAFAPVWLDQRRATAKMEALVAAVKRAGRDGLDPVLYDIAFVDERGGTGRKHFSEEDAGEVEVRLTLAYMQFASDLADGVSDLARSNPAWHMRPRTFDPAAHLTTAIADRKIVESLDALRPSNQEYRALGALLADYRNRASHGQSAPDADKVSLAERMKQIELIELNMERWRWLPRERAAKHIVVNIPAFRLDVWERDTVALSMRVVVGKKDTPTPIFNDAMTHVVFSPYWNVPPTIAKGETLPSALGDPSFLRRTNMEVLDEKGQVVDLEAIDLERAGDYKFRQRPGNGNALGLVKFMFPNEFNVYLHDTPADSLFARASRSFSHGCVRVEQPQALAEYLLKDSAEWTRETITEAMHAGVERTVKLLEPVPVYIGYWTVDVAPEGKATFLPDVYGLDARQGAALNERLARARQPARIASRDR